MIEFPKDFLWGAATSSYQVEGNNTNCDWWEWEKLLGKENSGPACRHYQFYEQDFDLAKELNHNCHRLSIEWSRVETEQGKFSQSEIDHYRAVILSLRERNIEPIVTLHHFTNPIWFSKLGGWYNPKAALYFLRYAERLVEALANRVYWWITINEPLVYAYHAYILGVWPPQEKSFLKANTAAAHMADSHVEAYKLIHRIYREKNLQAPYVSIAKNLQAFVSAKPTIKNKLAVFLRDRFYNFAFIEKLISRKTLDFIGVNYYTRGVADAKSWGLRGLLLGQGSDEQQLKKNSLGWDIYPQGLYQLLIKLKRYKLPILITENGLCVDDDNLRWEFIREHLDNIHWAMNDGADVIGYIYWALIDNFEWDKGFGPRFGLIEVDYNTYKRTIRESARRFAGVCRTGVLPNA